MALDLAEVSKAIMTAMAADGTVTGLVGARIYNRVPRSPTPPFVRLVQLPALPVTGILTSDAPYWLWDYTIDFTVFSDSASQAQAADVVKAISEVMEDKTQLTVTGAAVISSTPLTSGLVWDDDTETWTGLTSFRVVLQEAA